MRSPLVSLLGAIVVCGTWSVAHAQVPRADDIAACNSEAQHAVRQGTGSRESASPNMKDQSRAEEARRGNAPTDGAGTSSPDPQIHGMDAEGAKNPLYQAVYRTCMRKGGF